ncbi:hypothetical protein GFS24_19085 [Chitinophaga sp. SYP-B3965]|uniref:hypothetical protein n=1 Tax=Chitinophaga sp. SYP-B3965 TaxID=2663120 RepID=UPI001299C2EE|nr:hypothetical protein [Chitinophaga sp. SYP-B3965]MRG47234.1 hypothetical protein [Chitinophaga sp. SYP-B3965]
MKNELHINSELQLLTTTQMSEIRGGDIIDVNEFPSDIMEAELPKLPNLPTSMPTNIPPVYI